MSLHVLQRLFGCVFLALGLVRPVAPDEKKQKRQHQASQRTERGDCFGTALMRDIAFLTCLRTTESLCDIGLDVGEVTRASSSGTPEAFLTSCSNQPSTLHPARQQPTS